jgi:hypothetical protein
MQYLRRANGAERFVLSLHELRQHERLFLKGTAPTRFVVVAAYPGRDH